jgi:hypothetical protein
VARNIALRVMLRIRLKLKTMLAARLNELSELDRISITVAKPFVLPWYRLPFVHWTMIADGAVIRRGAVYASSDKLGKEARGVLVCESRLIGLRRSFETTIVPWDVDSKTLTFSRELGEYTILGCFEGRVYFTSESDLYYSDDGFETEIYISTLPWKLRYRSDRSLLLKTPVGWFLRTDGGVVHSKDLKKWSVAVEIGSRGMFQHLDYLVDEQSGSVFIFAAEYSTNADHRHGVYRGEYRIDGGVAWKRSFEFLSSLEGKNNVSGKFFARHIHVLTVDKATGTLWLATGDSNSESAIYYSENRGDNFKLFASGSQQYRTLMLIFTEKYLYWNMDTHSQDQHVYRIARTSYQPLLSTAGQLSSLVDKEKESVACLPYGAQWYGVIVKDLAGHDVLLMSASPESQVPGTEETPHRDWNARIFSLSGLDLQHPAVAEAASIPLREGVEGKFRRYNRVDPRCQDDNGYVYCMANNSFFYGAQMTKLNIES